jgi:hypothetical protein
MAGPFATLRGDLTSRPELFSNLMHADGLLPGVPGWSCARVPAIDSPKVACRNVLSGRVGVPEQLTKFPTASPAINKRYLGLRNCCLAPEIMYTIVSASAPGYDQVKT